MEWRELLVSDIKAVWKQISTWIFVILAPFPDIYNAAANLIGYSDIPATAKHIMYGFAFVGIAAKHYRQHAGEPKGEVVEGQSHDA